MSNINELVYVVHSGNSSTVYVRESVGSEKIVHFTGTKSEAMHVLEIARRDFKQHGIAAFN